MYDEESVNEIPMPTGDAWFEDLHYCIEAQLLGGKTGERGCATVPFYEGPPGVAKTAKVEQYVPWVYKYGSEVLGIAHPRAKVNIHILSQSDNVDIGGAIAPDFENNTIKRMIPDDILGLNDCEDYDIVINFIDEVSNTTPSMLSAIASVIEDGQIFGKKKAPNCVFVLAGNRPQDGTGSIKMPRQLMDGRLVHKPMTVDADEWIDWSVREDLHIKAVAPIRWKKELLYRYDPKTKGPNQTPRGWHKASNLLYIIPEDKTEAIARAVTGCIGAGAYAEARGFWDHSEHLALFEEVIADPNRCACPEVGTDPSAVSGQQAMGSNIAYHLQQMRQNKQFLSRTDAGAIMTYLNRFEGEISMWATRLCGDTNEDLKNCQEYSAFMERNKDLMILNS